MKKLLILLAVVMISFNTVIANEAITQPDNNSNHQKERMQRMAAFEQKLGLTEDQKIKARELRLQGYEKMKPVMEEIRNKHQEAKMVKLSRISVQMQEEKLAKIDEELKVLEKQAHEIRTQNMKEFEKILTKNQKKTLKQMKKEGRQKYHSEHPVQRQMCPNTHKI